MSRERPAPLLTLLNAPTLAAYTGDQVVLSWEPDGAFVLSDTGDPA